MRALTHKKSKRKQWNPKEHFRWIKKVYGNKTFTGGDDQLAADREDRNFAHRTIG